MISRGMVSWQIFFNLLRRNDGQLVAFFDLQIVELGCGLFDSDFCQMTGCG